MKMVARGAQCISMQLWSLCSIVIFVTVNIQDHVCHGKSCKVIPSQIIGRVTEDAVPFSIASRDNCTRCSGTEYYHCFSPTRLNDGQYENDNREIMLSLQGFHRERFYQWRYSTSDVPVLFVYPTSFALNSIKLYYETGILNSSRPDNTLTLGLPRLTFYQVPNGFQIWNYSNVNQLEQSAEVVKVGEYPYIRSTISTYGVSFHTILFTPTNVSTKKLLMVISFIEQGLDFSVSEIEFNVTSENSNCTPPEDEGGYITCHDVPKVQPTTAVSTEGDAGSPTTDINIKTQTGVTEPKDASSRTVSTTQTGVTEPKDENTNGIPEVAVGAICAVLLILIIVAVALTIIVIYVKNHKKNTGTDNTYYSVVDKPSPPVITTQDHNSVDSSTIKTGKNKSYETTNPESISAETGQSISPLYACVQKKKKKVTKEDNQEDEVNNPTSCDALYTAVQKKSKRGGNAVNGELENQPLQKKQNQAQVSDDQQDDEIECYPEHVYSAVQKKKKDKPSKETIPLSEIPDDLKEMYAVVQKKPKH